MVTPSANAIPLPPRQWADDQLVEVGPRSAPVSGVADHRHGAVAYPGLEHERSGPTGFDANPFGFALSAAGDPMTDKFRAMGLGAVRPFPSA
jgi:hypothetical protein